MSVEAVLIQRQESRRGLIGTSDYEDHCPQCLEIQALETRILNLIIEISPLISLDTDSSDDELSGLIRRQITNISAKLETSLKEHHALTAHDLPLEVKQMLNRLCSQNVTPELKEIITKICSPLW